MFGFLGPSEGKAHRRAAKSAQALRDEAIRDAMSEVRRLVGRQEEARLVRALLPKGHEQMDLTLGQAIDAAQETLDKVGRFNAGFLLELARVRKSAGRNGAGYGMLTAFESESREFMVRIRDEAETQLEPLRLLVADARALLGR
jgi:hypothetical protein